MAAVERRRSVSGTKPHALSNLAQPDSSAWWRRETEQSEYRVRPGSISQAASPRSSRREHAGTNAGAVLGELALALDATRPSQRPHTSPLGPGEPSIVLGDLIFSDDDEDFPRTADRPSAGFGAVPGAESVPTHRPSIPLTTAQPQRDSVSLFQELLTARKGDRQTLPQRSDSWVSTAREGGSHRVSVGGVLAAEPSSSRPLTASRKMASRRVIEVPAHQGPALQALMVAADEEDELEAAASLNASAPTPRAVPSTSRASSAREGAADASQPPTPSLQSYQALYLQQLALQRPEPEPVLPGAEDVPAELRPLFKEMQQYGLKQSVGDTLGLSAQSVQDRYMRTSLRVDNLPSAVCRTATGLMLVPLPGKRGVTGWTVNTAGQVWLRAGVQGRSGWEERLQQQGKVMKTRGVTSYLGMSPNVETVKRMQEEMEKTYQEEHGAVAAMAAAARSTSPPAPERTLERGRPGSVSRVRFGVSGTASAGQPAPHWSMNAKPMAFEELYPAFNRYVAGGRKLPMTEAEKAVDIRDVQAQRGLMEAVNKVCESNDTWDGSRYPVFEPSDNEIDDDFVFLTESVLPGEESNAGTLSREASTHSNPNSGNNSTRRRRRSSTASGAHISRRTSFVAPGKMSKMGSMEPVRPAGGMAQSPSRGQHSIKGGKLPHLSSRKSADVPRVVEEERGHKVTELTALPAAGAGGAGSPTSQAQHSAAVDSTAAAAGELHPTVLPPLSEAMIENVAFAAGQLLHHPSSPPRHALAVGLDQRGPGGGVIGIGLVKQMMGGQPEEDAGTVLSREDEDQELDKAFEELHTVMRSARRVRIRGAQTAQFKDAASKVAKMLGMLGRMALEEHAELQQKVESTFARYLDAWGDGVESGDQQVLTVGRLKELLIPRSMKPPPPEMRPFLPLEGEPVRASAAAVARRLQQCRENGDPTLDLAIAPRLTRGDFGVVFKALKDAPDAAACVTRLVATQSLLAASGPEGLWALLRCCPSFTELDVHANPSIGPAAAEQLARLLDPHVKLHLASLNLSRCPVKDEGFLALTQHMQFNRFMRKLDLEGAGLTDASLLSLDGFFKENVFLQSLNLSCNRFSAAGMQALASHLLPNKSLETLSLCDCALTDEAAVPFGALLAGNPTLRTLRLEDNNIGWAGAYQLAQGLLAATERFATTLGTLSLDRNPLGQAAVIELMKAVQQSDLMPQVTITGCSLDPIRGQHVYFDPSYPNGLYNLDLAKPEERQVAVRLVEEVWRPSAGASWASAQLSGRRLALKDSHNWPAAMPVEGLLRVNVICSAAVQCDLPPYPVPPGMDEAAYVASAVAAERRPHQLLSQQLCGMAVAQLARPECSDVWRMGYVSLLTNVAHVQSEQAVQLLRHFVYRKEKLACADRGHNMRYDASLLLALHLTSSSPLHLPLLHKAAARLLLSVTLDLHAWSRVLCAPPPAGALDADDLLDFLNLLGLGACCPAKAPLEPGWQLSCTGHYVLNLGMQVQRWFAALLVELGQMQNSAVDPLAPLQPTAIGGADTDPHAPRSPSGAAVGSGAVVRLGDCTSRMLHVRYNGQRLDTLVIFLLSSMLPTSGTLDMHFFNVPLNRHRMVKVGPSRLAMVSPLLVAQVAAGQQRTAAEHMAVCLSNWESLFLDLLKQMRLMPINAKLGPWQQGSRVWRQSEEAARLEQLREEARARHVAFAREAEAAAAAAKAEAAEGEAEGEAGGKKGKKGKKGAKKGGKKLGGKAAAKAAKEAAKAAAAAAEALELRVQAAAAAARGLLPQVLKHSIAHSVTCRQLLYLVRLFPDLASRLLLVEALQPALWDPAYITDVVLDLDHPVLVPLAAEEYKKQQQEAQLRHAPHKAGPHEHGDATKSRALPMGGAADRGISFQFRVPENKAGAEAPKQTQATWPTPAETDETLPPGETAKEGVAVQGDSVQTAAAGSAAAVPPPEPESLPQGFTKSSDAASQLLAMAAERLGWCRLALPWARPLSLDGIPITLDLSQAEHLQCLMRLCRFSDYFAFAAIDAALSGGTATSDLAHAGPVMHGLLGDGGAFEVDSMAGPALDQVLGYCCGPAPEVGLAGHLQLQLSVSAIHQRQAAAVMIQATWRGHRVRLQQYAAVKATFASNRWRAAWGCYVWLRRLAFMRRLATDLSISRMLMQLTANTHLAASQKTQLGL